MSAAGSESAGCLVVYTSCAAGRDDEFNRWYDEIHIPEVLALGPFRRARRYRLASAQFMPQTHSYLALYEFRGSAAEAVAALNAAASKFHMSDTMGEAFVSTAEALGPAQQA